MNQESESAATGSAARFLHGGGEMGDRIRAFDWSKTSLGPCETWPESLKTAVRIVVGSRYQMFVWWGEDLINIYNDAYAPLLGQRHPSALGQPAAEIWREIWPAVGPQAEIVLRHGRATWNDRVQLIMERNGYPEEMFATWSYSPAPKDDGTVGGVFCACYEETERVLGERRLATLRQLADADGESPEEACRLAATALEANASDISFALIYLLDPDGRRARLMESIRERSRGFVAPEVVSFDQRTDACLWPFDRVLHGERVTMKDLTQCTRLSGGVWPEATHTAMVLPLAKHMQERPSGFVVLGASPRLPFNDTYEAFFELVSAHIASAVAKGRAFDDERRRAEALAELDRAKTLFFSNVSHEFRTPLTLMLDPLEDALKDPVSMSAPAHRTRLEFAYRNSQRLLKLVNSLLDFARLEGGRVEATYEPTDLSMLTTDLAGVFRSAMEQAGLTLHVNCPPLSEPVYLDRDMWEKIVLNLLSNAFKFTFEGSITVRLSEEASPSRCAVLRVQDTGTGIPEDQLGRVFERFHRVPDARGRSMEGTGIGLALVKGLVHLHGGSIEVISTVDQGSTFIVRLPLGSAHLPPDRVRGSRHLASTAIRSDVFVEEALRSLPEDVSGEALGERDQTNQEVKSGKDGLCLAPDASRPRVIIVDDNADMRTYISRVLEPHYRVVTAADGQTALERILAHPPDLVLADVMMPKLDGFGLVQELRKYLHTRTIPIILLSARAGEESRIEGLERGADDYLIKPFSGKELLARVAAHVDIARVRRDAEQAVRRRSEQFEILLNRAPLGVYLVDADFRIVQVNPVALPVFGDIPNLIGRDFEEVVRIIWEKPYADELVTIFRRTLDTGEAYSAPERIERRVDRGITESYEWRVDRIMLPDGRFGVVCYFRDVSVQVLAREALRQSEDRLREFAAQLEQLVADRTQELVQSQTRLRALATELNLAEQRERKRLAAELHDHLQQMLVLGKLKLGQGMRLPQGADRIVEIMKQTDDVLGEALQYTRTLVAELSPPVLHEHGLAAGLLWLGNEMKRHDLNVTVQVPGTEMPLPEDQAVLLFQSVRELLINASKHANSHEAHVVLERQNGNLRIEVKDSGVGFDVAKVAVPSTDNPQNALSSKFGLFSIRERMKALGGTFEIRSSPGGGTMATVSLPIDAAALTEHRGLPGDAAVLERTGRDKRASAPSTSQRGPFSLQHRQTKVRVLLVDDHAMVREGLRSVLESYDDVEVVGEASNGAEALALVERLRPMLVVMDINMPVMSGIEATVHISRAYPEVLVIGLSVNATGNNVEAMLKAGAVLLLTKEAAVNELYRRMRQVLEGQLTK
jgi:signal transduction histidine kinase